MGLPFNHGKPEKHKKLEAPKPPYTKRGVELRRIRVSMTVEFIVDYLRVTIHAPTWECIDLYKDHFQLALGALSDLEHGARGFKGVLGGLSGFQLRHSPGSGREYCSFEFPGEACKAIPPEFFRLFYHDLILMEHKFKVTRLDLAFDNVPFTPEQFEQAILDDVNRAENEKPVVRSLANRKTLKWYCESLKMREDQSEMGRDTCYFGSRQSERLMRVYNMRGPTRVELELKGKISDIVARELFSREIDDWPEVSISHLQNFIDIDRSWWDEFIGDTDRAYTKLHDAKEISLDKIKAWLLNQVAPALSAVSECTGGEFLLQMDIEGRKRMHKRYGTLLAAHEKDIEFE